MLKKNNKILLGSLVFLLILSVGYALFSDTITINGTATAKGNFDYEIVCTPGISEELESSDIDYSNYSYFNSGKFYDTELSFIKEEYPEKGYNNDKCEVNGNNVSFTTNFIGPGSTRFFTVKLTNKGSIPIKTGSTTSSLEVNAKVTSINGTVVNLTKSDFFYQNGFAWTAGEAADIKDISTFELKKEDSGYFLIILNYPEKLLMNVAEGRPVCTGGSNADASCFVPGNGRTKKVDLNINYTINLPIQQTTVE